MSRPFIIDCGHSQKTSIQFFERNIFILHERLASAMDLESDESALWDRRIAFRVIYCLRSINVKSYAFSFGPDLVVVPLIALKDIYDGGGVGCCQCFIAPRFVVETAPIAIAEISLITRHFVGRILQSFAAKLDPGVDKSTVALKLEFQTEHEVGIPLACAQKVVVRNGSLQRASRERQILDLPGVGGITFPAAESLSVKNQIGFGLALEDCQQDKCKQESVHMHWF